MFVFVKILYKEKFLNNVNFKDLECKFLRFGLFLIRFIKNLFGNIDSYNNLCEKWRVLF